LLAARLDALEPAVRSLAGDAAVIAAPFTAETLVDVSGLDPAHVQAGLAELAHRDVLQISADTLSPQIGAYSFTHGLLAQVAYQTLSRRDLKERHLRVAAHLAASTRNDGDALAEVIARHHLDALDARPHDDDAGSLRATAVEWLVRAAERARSTGAQATAARLFASAADLTGDADEAAALRSADLWMQSATASYEEADYEPCLEAAERAQQLRLAHGRTRLAAVVEGLRGRALRRSGRGEEARPLLMSAMEVLADEPGLDTVEVTAALASVCAVDPTDASDELTTQAISLAERLGAGNRLLADAFNSRGLIMMRLGRRLESIGYFQQSLGFAEAAGDMPAIATALGNLADCNLFASPREALGYTERGGQIARQVGSRYGMGLSVINGALCMLRLGEWDRAADAVATALDRDGLGDIAEVTVAAALVWSLRGDPARARSIFQQLRSTSSDEQAASYDELTLGLMCSAEGDKKSGLRHARAALEDLNPTIDPYVLAWPLAARLAHEVADRDALAELMRMVDAHHVGELPPLVRAERRLAVARLVGEPTERVAAIEDAVADLRAEGSPYHLALALLDLAEAQRVAGKDPADVLAEATSIGTVLGCPAVLDRAAVLAL
jgi:tetratricopeptide (TPR) repeat protein